MFYFYTTVGIGDNPLLAKLALDNEAKRNKEFIAEWRYENVQEKVWSIAPITEFGVTGTSIQKIAVEFKTRTF